MEKIKCPYCGKEIVVEVGVKKEEQQESKIKGFDDMLAKFNGVLVSRGYRAVVPTMGIYGAMRWMYAFADSLYNGGHWAFLPSTYPLLFDYRETGEGKSEQAYDAMQSWIMAMTLAELVPDSGEITNTQTKLFYEAYRIGGDSVVDLYSHAPLTEDPYAMREVGSVIQSICRGDRNVSDNIGLYRDELGGKVVNASCWEELGYRNTEIRDASGWRAGYRMEYLGYCVNTDQFLPDAPGPRVPDTTACVNPWPWDEGQDERLFGDDGNYDTDRAANAYFVDEYDMMSETPEEKWLSYPIEKRNRLVNAAAVPPCTFRYMFGEPIRVKFDGVQHKSYDGKTYADYYCFSRTGEDTGLVLDGPFSDLEGMYRYNAVQRNDREQFVYEGARVADFYRMPTQDPNYGRCRPGCACTREGGWKINVPGADENELYNVDLTAMVADDDGMRQRLEHEDGLAYDSPRSYVSGHSAQIWALALLLTQADNDETARPESWVRKAYEYSVNRTVGRYHWNSDIIYGRMFGMMAVPVIRAMSGMQKGMQAFTDFVRGKAGGDYEVNLIIRNETGQPIQSTGEVRLYVEDHVGINTYLPGACLEAGALYTFNVGENAYCGMGIRCVMNGEDYMDGKYDGAAVDGVRVYDCRHWKSEDCGWRVFLDVADSRCCPVIRKEGATYVIVIKNQ